MSPRLLGNLITLFGMCTWSTSFITIELLLESWDPLLLPPVRLGAASLTLILLLLASGRGGDLLGAPWWDVFRIGAIGVGLSTVCLIVGQAYSDPVTVSIITTGNPLVAAVMGFLVGDERPNWKILTGVGLAMTGGITATLAAAGAGPGFLGGEFLILGSSVLFIWFTRNSVRRLSGINDIAKAALTLGGAAVALAPLSVLALLTGIAEPRYDVSLRSLGLIAWLGAVAVGLSLVCWFTGCRLLGSVTIASIHQNTVPFWVMLATVMLGGALFQGQIWGALLVIAGALLAQVSLPRVWPFRRI